MEIKPIIGIPMERNVSDIAFIRFWEIAASNGFPLIPLPYGRADVNRNRLARFFMQTDSSHLIMLDLDHIHPHDVVQKLLRWQVQDPKRLVVGGLNFKRAKPYEACAYLRMEDGLHPLVKWGEGLAEVDAIGFGCVSFAREVFNIVDDPWFRTIYDAENDFPGEDIYFSNECKRKGVSIWCDTTLTSPHIAVELVGQELHNKHLDENPVDYTRVV